jgi:hypothetical protein
MMKGFHSVSSVISVADRHSLLDGMTQLTSSVNSSRHTKKLTVCTADAGGTGIPAGVGIPAFHC